MVHQVRTDGFTTSPSSSSLSSGHPAERGNQTTTTTTRPLSQCSWTDRSSEQVCQLEDGLLHYFHHDVVEGRLWLSHGGSRLTCASHLNRTRTRGGRLTVYRETGLGLAKIADELERKMSRLQQMADTGRELRKVADEFWIELHPPLDSETEDEVITVRARGNC